MIVISMPTLVKGTRNRPSRTVRMFALLPPCSLIHAPVAIGGVIALRGFGPQEMAVAAGG